MTAEELQEGRLKNAIATGAIAAASLMPNSAKAVEPINPQELYTQIKNHEGFKDTVYKDSEGIPTIGIGFNLKSKANLAFLNRHPEIRQKIKSHKPLSTRDIQTLYNFSLRLAYKDAVDIFPNFKQLPKMARRVLLDMSFNLGKTRFMEFKKMRRAITNYDFDTAADEMVDSTWYRQVKTRGKNLEQMMRSVNR